jgi:Flp pilus assembly protein TadB
MTNVVLLLGLLLLGLGAIASLGRNVRYLARARKRLEPRDGAGGPSQVKRDAMARTFLVRHRFLPWALGLAAAAFLHLLLGWALPFVIAVGLIIAVLAGQGEAFLAARKVARMESQLADAIDLMVAALGAGAGVAEALQNALRESRNPLRNQLEEVVGRLRLGDDPRTVYRGLAERVPLETFLLFSTALAVQSETGGSLAPTLASVGKTIRDRIEIARRIQSNSVQSQISTLAVLVLTYFIALVVWRMNPEQMERFLATSVGQWAVAGTMMLQATGLAWMSLISRLRF